MPWRESIQPVPMQRVALVAPVEALRAALVTVAGCGAVELDLPLPAGEAARGEAGRRLQRTGTEPPEVRLALGAPDLDAWEQAGRFDLLAGEAQVEERAAQAVVRGPVAGLTGWAPSTEVPELAERLRPDGAALVPLPLPPGVDPPTLLQRGGVAGSFAPLVETYAPVPYADVDPSALIGVAYVAMFGMMFADVGHGLVLLLAAFLLRSGRIRRLARLRAAWPFLAGAGLASGVAGLAYGEFLGPTGVVPTLWMVPLDHPVRLLQTAVGVGALLLGLAYGVGTANRWREGGWRLALYAPTGLAGSALFAGLGLVALGWYVHVVALVVVGVLVAVSGTVLAGIGLVATSGGGPAGAMQAAVELFDLVVRLGSNLVSFARLAAFGLTHAAVGGIVWDGTTGLWDRGGWAALAAPLVFLGGNAVSFALEALVAAVQALRLAYYELFSRIFTTEGRPFRPWYLPVVPEGV